MDAKCGFNIKLRDCPFCGGRPETMIELDADKDLKFIITCRYCEATVRRYFIFDTELLTNNSFEKAITKIQKVVGLWNGQGLTKDDV